MEQIVELIETLSSLMQKAVRAVWFAPDRLNMNKRSCSSCQGKSQVHHTASCSATPWVHGVSVYKSAYRKLFTQIMEVQNVRLNGMLNML